MKVVMRVELTNEELRKLGYPVVVEGWSKKNFGRVKRAFNKEFPEPSDKRKAKYWHDRFYSWHIVNGTPKTCPLVKATDYAFIQRLCNFFGTI